MDFHKRGLGCHLRGGQFIILSREREREEYDRNAEFGGVDKYKDADDKALMVVVMVMVVSVLSDHRRIMWNIEAM